MLIYAFFQYRTMPDVPFWKILIGHSWHVLVIGALTYGTLNVLLHRKVVQPVRDLYVKLYGISQGDNAPVHIDTNIREIQDIAESINLMLSQFDRTSHEPWVGTLRDRGGALKELSKREAVPLQSSDKEMLARTASELGELASVLERFEAKVQHLDHDLL